MSDILAVSILELSPNSRRALERNGVDTLSELMAHRGFGFLTPENYDSESLRELIKVCDEIDKFYKRLNERIVSLDKIEHKGSKQEKDYSFDEGRHRAFESIKKDLISVMNLEQPTSLRKAILTVFAGSADGVFDRKMIKTLVERKCRRAVSTNTDAIRSALSSLVSHGFLKRVGGGYTRGAIFNKIIKESGFLERREGLNRFEVLEVEKLKHFLDSHIGKEIEFRYKTERAGSDKKWRRVRVYDHDDTYLMTTGSYLSGRRINYLKEKIVEYREVDD
ncbi:hypothetical protein IJJ36_01930 [Candidatus Saccharibacteria bacterium]|nr:hypothetical protein [Candidatus Saccharibacteria bacterium]